MKKSEYKSKSKLRFLANCDTRRELLTHETSAEKSAQRILKEMGIEYIRQYPISTGRKTFFADLYIPRYRMVLELDGGYHYTDKQKRLDANRSACIRRLGYHVYRLPNSRAFSKNDLMRKILSITR